MPLAPARRRGAEILDAEVSPDIRHRSHRDIALANALFGGVRAVRAEVEPLLRSGTGELSLLDVGTGTGDIPARLVTAAARRGVALHVIGLDAQSELISAMRKHPIHPICASALSLPFASGSIDVVCCSQTLHHFNGPDAQVLIREMHRVARQRVIISDLSRSRVAAAALWGVSFLLGFHTVSRHDGVVSIYRGFTARELRSLVEEAVGVRPKVTRRVAFRLTASWNPRETAGGRNA